MRKVKIFNKKITTNKQLIRVVRIITIIKTP